MTEPNDDDDDAAINRETWGDEFRGNRRFPADDERDGPEAVAFLRRIEEEADDADTVEIEYVPTTDEFGRMLVTHRAADADYHPAANGRVALHGLDPDTRGTHDDLMARLLSARPVKRRARIWRGEITDPRDEEDEPGAEA